MHSNWKLLNVDYYKGYSFVILGHYNEVTETTFGDNTYVENIETKVEIYNKNGDLIHEMNWYDYHQSLSVDYKFLIHFRLKKKYSWWRLLPKITGVINIEDDYYRVIDDWKKYCRCKIDSVISREEKEVYFKDMTDGLPESIFIKYRD